MHHPDDYRMVLPCFLERPTYASVAGAHILTYGFVDASEFSLIRVGRPDHPSSGFSDIVASISR